MSIERDVRHARRQAMERLTALRDEGRVQLHLLSLDAAKQWKILEKEISALEEHVADDSVKAAQAVKDAAQALTRQLKDFMTRHTDHAGGLLTNVRALMTTPVRTCRPDDSLARSAQAMWEGNCGAIPVVAYERVVGIITDRDVCMATYTQGEPPARLWVESAMSKQLFSCAPDESIGSVLTMMGEKRVRRLPVVGEDGRLLGIITLADVARWARSLGNPAVDAALSDTLGRISALSPEKLAPPSHDAAVMASGATGGI